MDWGTSALSPPPAEPSPAASATAAARQSLEQQPVVAAAPEVFGSSGHSLSVNQKYTDDLKSVIGLGGGGTVKSPSNQSASNNSPTVVPVSLNSSHMDTFQQQISQMTKQSNTAMDSTERKN